MTVIDQLGISANMSPPCCSHSCLNADLAIRTVMQATDAAQIQGLVNPVNVSVPSLEPLETRHLTNSKTDRLTSIFWTGPNHCNNSSRHDRTCQALEEV